MPQFDPMWFLKGLGLVYLEALGIMSVIGAVAVGIACLYRKIRKS